MNSPKTHPIVPDTPFALDTPTVHRHQILDGYQRIEIVRRQTAPAFDLSDTEITGWEVMVYLTVACVGLFLALVGVHLVTAVLL